MILLATRLRCIQHWRRALAIFAFVMMMLLNVMRSAAVCVIGSCIHH